MTTIVCKYHRENTPCKKNSCKDLHFRDDITDRINSIRGIHPRAFSAICRLDAQSSMLTGRSACTGPHCHRIHISLDERYKPPKTLYLTNRSSDEKTKNMLKDETDKVAQLQMDLNYQDQELESIKRKIDDQVSEIEHLQIQNARLHAQGIKHRETEIIIQEFARQAMPDAQRKKRNERDMPHAGVSKRRRISNNRMECLVPTYKPPPPRIGYPGIYINPHTQTPLPIECVSMDFNSVWLIKDSRPIDQP